MLVVLPSARVGIFEAFAIFGALFLAGTWILYEWGSGLAYGGSIEGDEIMNLHIGRSDIDMSSYISRLEDDLYTHVEHLVGKDIDALSRYMPRRLAKEVHRILIEC